MASSVRNTTAHLRRRAGLGLAAAALLALTACGGGDPYGAPAPSAAAGSAQLPPMDMAPFTLDVPSLDLALVPGATIAVTEGQDPEHHGGWLEVPGARTWTDSMSAAVRDQVEAYRRDTDVSADPTLDVQPLLAVAGPDVAAVRLLSTETRGTESVSAVQASWYAARADRVLTTADLFTPEGWDAFRAEVRERMTNDPEIVQDRLTSAVDAPDQAENRRIWDAVVLLPDGSALLEVDQAALAPAAAGVLTTRIPAETVQSWLSEVGRAAQDAARTPATVQLPETAAGPAPQDPEGSDTGAPAPALPPVTPLAPTDDAGTPGADPTSDAPGGTSPGGTTPGDTSPGSTAPGAPIPGLPLPPPAGGGPGTSEAPAPGTSPAPTPWTPAPTSAPPRTGTPSPSGGAPTTAPGTPTPRPTSVTPIPTGSPSPAPGSPTRPPSTAPAPTPTPTPPSPSDPGTPVEPSATPAPTDPPVSPEPSAPAPSSPAPSETVAAPSSAPAAAAPPVSETSSAPATEAAPTVSEPAPEPTAIVPTS